MFISAEAARRARRRAPTASSRGCAAKLAKIPGAPTFLQPVQDLRIGGRVEQRAVPVHAAGREPRRARRVGAARRCRRCARCRSSPTSTAISRTRACEATLVIDRATAARLGVSPQRVDDTLYDAFGQRQVAITYTAAEPVPRRAWRSRRASGSGPRRCATSTSARRAARQVPLAAFTHYEPTATTLAVNHQGQFPAVTLSFNLAPGVALGDGGGGDRGGDRASVGMPARSAAASRARRRRSRPRSRTSRC